MGRNAGPVQGVRATLCGGAFPGVCGSPTANGEGRCSPLHRPGGRVGGDRVGGQLPRDERGRHAAELAALAPLTPTLVPEGRDRGGPQPLRMPPGGVLGQRALL